MLAVLSGAAGNSAAAVIRALLMAGLDPEKNTALTNIKKFGNESVLWEMISRYTGYAHTNGDSLLLPLASHLLLTALSVTMPKACLKGLEPMISEQHQQACYALVNEWMHSDDDDELYLNIYLFAFPLIQTHMAMDRTSQAKPIPPLRGNH